MRKTTKLSTIVLLLVICCWSLHAAGGSHAPATGPARPYRLLLRSVAGAQPSEWVFIIVSPDGDPSVTTFSKLQWMIEHAVKAPATLNWEPSDAKLGTEPLDNPADEESLASFCKEHNIKFVHIPAG